MYFYLFIVSLLAAATARSISENYDPHFVPPPSDFPKRPSLRQTPESLGTGIISDQGNGDAIPQEKPKERSHEFKNENDRRYHDHRQPVYQEESKYFANFGPEKKGPQDNSRTILQEKSNDEEFTEYVHTQEGSKEIQEKPPHGRNFDSFDFESTDEHKNHNCIKRKTKTDINVSEKRNQQDAKVDFPSIKNSTDNRFHKSQPKTNVNNTNSKTSDDNEVLLEGRTMASDLPGYMSDGKWIWRDTTTLTPTDLDDRAAFDGGQCPTGQVRIQGSDMCVDKDED